MIKELSQNSLLFLQPTAKFRELVLLDAISQNASVTQSKLASIAGIVPAMVNNYLKDFFRQEFLSREGNNRDMKYYLTPKGEEYKLKLLLDYFKEAVSLYKNVKLAIRKRLQEFQEEGIRVIVLYGAAETGEITVSAAEEIGLKVISFVDNDPIKQGKEIHGKIIESPEVIESLQPDALIIASSGFQDELYENNKFYEAKGIKVRKL